MSAKYTLKKRPTRHAYALELKGLIEERTGKPCDLWLYPQIRSTAANEEMLDKIQDELLAGDLLTLAVGSTGQQKTEVNPLLTQYDKMQRTLAQQLEALGLNFNATPRKLTENTRQGGSEQDRLTRLLDDIRDIE